MTSLTNNAKAVRALDHAQITSTATGDTIDCAGYSQVDFFLHTTAAGGADGSNYFTSKVYEGDASNMSDEAEITDTKRISGTKTVFNDATNQADAVNKFGVAVGVKRYMRLKLAETGTADLTVNAIALLTPPGASPVA